MQSQGWSFLRTTISLYSWGGLRKSWRGIKEFLQTSVRKLVCIVWIRNKKVLKRAVGIWWRGMEQSCWVLTRLFFCAFWLVIQWFACISLYKMVLLQGMVLINNRKRPLFFFYFSVFVKEWCIRVIHLLFILTYSSDTSVYLLSIPYFELVRFYSL